MTIFLPWGGPYTPRLRLSSLPSMMSWEDKGKGAGLNTSNSGLGVLSDTYLGHVGRGLSAKVEEEAYVLGGETLLNMQGGGVEFNIDRGG